MKIDATLIKAEREKRTWSQEQLATVSGLGLSGATDLCYPAAD